MLRYPHVMMATGRAHDVFGTLGMQEMIVIFFLALVLFGPKKLPELGRTIGKAITEFRRASNDLKASFEREMQTLERESQSMSQVAQVTAGEIFERAINYLPEENRSLPPAESSSNPPESANGAAETQSAAEYSAELSASANLSTATEPSTVGASAVSGAESNGTTEEAEATPPEPVPVLGGTVPRNEPSQHS